MSKQEEFRNFTHLWRACPIAQQENLGVISFLEIFCQKSIGGRDSGAISLYASLINNPDVSCQEEGMMCSLCTIYQKFNGEE